ncbi:hypothetical protein B0I35DRAFT_453895 [Stachybotrys elegans]|uniref:F-box domain-containing protein n=1 Tax=Stachybotrys elegans TaxID=80388 RepID=A0A8K0SD69_9HYPO|nr:hypothetical protein B0I35DRAFT_453895 [Stachybotrys elegans]
MASKRLLPSYSSDSDSDGHSPRTDTRAKRPRQHITDHTQPTVVTSPSSSRPTSVSDATSSAALPIHSHLARLSDELLVRILSYMDEKTLLHIAPVSKRFNRITADSQLWRPHYYRRFILARAHRIPGFKNSSRSAHYAANKSLRGEGSNRRTTAPAAPKDAASTTLIDAVDWKKQYRLRHNWARGTCEVEEVDVSDSDKETSYEGLKTLVKVADGLAVTVDSNRGLRAWDLRTRQIIAQVDIGVDEAYSQPTCLAVDGQRLYRDILDIAVGFLDGTFGVWMLDIRRKKLSRLYRHRHSFFGHLASIAYLHPYLMTATHVGYIALYTFEQHASAAPGAGSQKQATDDATQTLLDSIAAAAQGALTPGSTINNGDRLPAPTTLITLKSHSTKPPMTLSIRRMPNSVIASVAYTFNTVDGWSIGIQDIDINPSDMSKPEVVTSRVAYSLPTKSRSPAPSSEISPYRPTSSTSSSEPTQPDGPIRLCYSHPYLLATMPDNTLILYLCTFKTTSLSISPGLRLWGHTSGISDAEITPRGKAVSVSSRGDEIRVWDLEGRVGGSSVEVRPRQQRSNAGCCCQGECTNAGRAYQRADIGDRRNWVGFDDEMVIVLKEAQDGRESLMVYDFT